MTIEHNFGRILERLQGVSAKKASLFEIPGIVIRSLVVKYGGTKVRKSRKEAEPENPILQMPLYKTSDKIQSLLRHFYVQNIEKGKREYPTDIEAANIIKYYIDKNPDIDPDVLDFWNEAMEYYFGGWDFEKIELPDLESKLLTEYKVKFQDHLFRDGNKSFSNKQDLLNAIRRG